MTSPLPEDEFTEAWKALEDYYLPPGLRSTTVVIDGERFLLERDGNSSRLDSLEPEPPGAWRRVPTSDAGKLELARRIREHLEAAMTP